MKRVKIKNSLGSNIAVVINRPNSEAGKLAILCPGYLDSKDYDHLSSLADELSKKGYTVARFDPTGTWESDGDISEYTTVQTVNDIESILEHMSQEADYKHILVGGHSRGGRLSILYSANNPKVSLVLGIMPSSKPPSGSKRKEWEDTGFRISWRDLPGDKSKKREFHIPYARVENPVQYDAVEDVRKITSPIILIAGELDDTVLPEDVKEIYNNANEPKKFIVIPGIGHDYRHNTAEIKKVNDEILGNI